MRLEGTVHSFVQEVNNFVCFQAMNRKVMQFDQHPSNQLCTKLVHGDAKMSKWRLCFGEARWVGYYDAWGELTQERVCAKVVFPLETPTPKGASCDSQVFHHVKKYQENHQISTERYHALERHSIELFCEKETFGFFHLLVFVVLKNSFINVRNITFQARSCVF